MPDPETIKTAATDGALWKAAGAGLGALATAATAVFAFLFQRVVKKHDDEISGINERLDEVGTTLHKLEIAVGKDFVGKNTYEQNRIERREAEISLHRKIDEATRDIHSKIDETSKEARAQFQQIMVELSRRRDTRRSGD